MVADSRQGGDGLFDKLYTVVKALREINTPNVSAAGVTEDWKPFDGDGTDLTAGQEYEEVAALLNGFDRVKTYRYQSGLYSDALNGLRDKYGRPMTGPVGWDYLGSRGKPVHTARTQWGSENLYIHGGKYAVAEDPSRCIIKVRASAAYDVDPATGERVTEPEGRLRTLHITGILPELDDISPEEYLEQQLYY